MRLNHAKCYCNVFQAMVNTACVRCTTCFWLDLRRRAERTTKTRYFSPMCSRLLCLLTTVWLVWLACCMCISVLASPHLISLSLSLSLSLSPFHRHLKYVHFSLVLYKERFVFIAYPIVISHTWTFVCWWHLYDIAFWKIMDELHDM